MKVWITKYALTTGILVAEAKLTEFEGMISIPPPSRRSGYADRLFHGEGRDWHTSRESALKRFEVMVKAKMASHQKALEKLSSMKARFVEEA